MLALKSTRLSQGGVSQVDWGNPITRKLIADINPAATNASRLGSVPLLPIQQGIALSQNGSSMLHVPTTPLGSEATILLYGNLIRSSSNINFGIGNAAGGSQLFTIQGSLLSDSARALIRTVNGGGVTTAESATVGLADAPVAVWCAVYDGTTSLKLYRDGFDDTASNNNTDASGSIATLSRFSLGGVRRSTDAFCASGNLQLLGFAWSRALSPTEVLTVSANPWQIFR